MEQQTRLEVARVVRAKRGPLKNASATAALVMLSGAALAPVLAAVAGGAGAAAALAAFAGVAGNVGGGHLTDVIERLSPGWWRSR